MQEMCMVVVFFLSQRLSWQVYFKNKKPALEKALSDLRWLDATTTKVCNVAPRLCILDG